jgi:hypothetical protein
MHVNMGSLKEALAGALVSNDERLRFEVGVELLDSVEGYDSHTCTITITSVSEIYEDFVIAAIRSLRSLEVPMCAECDIPESHIAIIVPQDPVFSEDRKTVTVDTIVVNNLEKVK